MALFEPALTATLKHEDPQLSGIITKDPSRDHPDAVARFGINSGAWPKALTEGFYTMDRDAALIWASNFYKYNFFSPIGGYQITDQSIANKYFDMAVNQGIPQATKIVQRAVNNLLTPLQIGLAVDGKAGQHTINGINMSMPSALLGAIREQAKDFYVELVAANSKLRPDLDGWLKRAES